MLSTSFIAHYNAPQFYKELKNPTLPRFNQVVGGAFSASILFFVFIMSIGFLTFGGSSLGFILNNYAGSDYFATAARLAIGFALLTGYPFTFSALREGILDLRKLTGVKRENAMQTTTIASLSVLTLLALFFKDVGFVVSISGAMFGCALMFIVPAIMNIVSTSSIAKKNNTKLTNLSKFELGANYGMIVTGIIMTVLGVSVSVLKQIGKL
jgi:amino acid permease